MSAEITASEELNGEVWWELYDENYKINYYYNVTTQQTLWERPSTGIIIIPEIEDEDKNEEKLLDEMEEQTRLQEERRLSLEIQIKQEETKVEIISNQTDSENKGEFEFIKIEKRENSKNGKIIIPPIPIPAPILDEDDEQENITEEIIKNIPPPPSVKPLLEEWEEYYDEEKKLYYYLNTNSKVKTFNRNVACGNQELTDKDVIPDESMGKKNENRRSLILAPDSIPREYPNYVASPHTFENKVPKSKVTTKQTSNELNENKKFPPLPELPDLPEVGITKIKSVDDELDPDPQFSLGAGSQPMQAYSNPEEVLVRDKKMRKNSSSRKSARLSRKLDTSEKKEKEKVEVGEKKEKGDSDKKKSRRDRRPRSKTNDFLPAGANEAEMSSEDLKILKKLTAGSGIIDLPVSGNNSDTESEGGSVIRSLPTHLKKDINMFQLEKYAEKYFEQHKRGIFRRLVPVQEMLMWSKELIPTSLTRLRNEVYAKEAVRIFRFIQMYMGDRPGKSEPLLIMQEIIGKGINQPELRDEIYCQLSKQTCYNPDEKSLHRGWELFVVCSIYFPPSRDLEEWLFNYIGVNSSVNDTLQTYAKYVIKKLNMICRNGPRGRLPTIRELDQQRVAPFNRSVFGVNLEEVMELQSQTHPNLNIPVIVQSLCDAIIRTNGLFAEGIFRVPGDTEQVYGLRIQLDKGDFDLSNITDPNTPASLLKLWLRELSEALIPAEFYQECVNFGEDEPDCFEKAFAVLDKLPEVNRLTCLYVVSFLQKVAEEENQVHNKMSISNLAMVFAPNFLRCPSSDPQVILNNTKREQTWLRLLIQHIPKQK